MKIADLCDMTPFDLVQKSTNLNVVTSVRLWAHIFTKLFFGAK